MVIANLLSLNLLLVLFASLSAHVCGRSHEVDTGRDLEEISVDVPESFNITFAWWCDGACSFRAFADIGGVPCLIDTGSSSLAFCEMPEQPNVKDVERAIQISSGENISQCVAYGDGTLTHGFFGDSYLGNVSYSKDQKDDLFMDGVLFTAMEKMVGEGENACGPAGTGSRGLKDDQVIGGIWGVASPALNSYVLSSDMDQLDGTWADVPDNGLCNATAGQCLCPEIAGIEYDSLLGYLTENGADEWAISWDGSLGDGSGMMLFGDAASAALPTDSPKVPLDFSDGFYRTNVTAIEVEGEIMSQDGPISYIFDTGTPTITLPPSVVSALDSEGKTSANVVFQFPMLNGAEGDYATVNITVTSDLFNSDEFEVGGSEPGSLYFFGLPMMRYLDNVVLHFVGEPTYFMGIQRDVHITDPAEKLPLVGQSTSDAVTFATSIGWIGVAFIAATMMVLA